MVFNDLKGFYGFSRYKIVIEKTVHEQSKKGILVYKRRNKLRIIYMSGPLIQHSFQRLDILWKQSA